MTATTVTRGALRAPLISPRRAAPPNRRAHLRVVPDAERVARRTRRRVVSGVLITVLTVLTVVVFHVLLAQSQIALERLEQRTAAAEERYNEARLAHDHMTSPNAIVPKASELGLALPATPPTPVQVPQADVPARQAAPSTLQSAQDVKQAVAEP